MREPHSKAGLPVELSIVPEHGAKAVCGIEGKAERERSHGRWWGGFPWLHKRGFGSAEAREGPRQCRRESFTPRGMYPGFRTRGREGAIAV
jgi:hypothetical protein